MQYTFSLSFHWNIIHKHFATLVTQEENKIIGGV